MKPRLLVRQTGSVTNQTEHTRKILKGLGLSRPGSKVIVANTPSFRGMVKKVIHLVEVTETDEGGATGAAKV